MTKDTSRGKFTGTWLTYIVVTINKIIQTVQAGPSSLCEDAYRT